MTDNLIYECGEGETFRNVATSKTENDIGGDDSSYHAKSNYVEGETSSAADSNNEQTTIVTQSESTIVPRPRPIKPVINIDTRNDILEVSHNHDGTVTIALTNSNNNNEKAHDDGHINNNDAAANTISVANGDRPSQVTNDIIAMSSSFATSETASSTLSFNNNNNNLPPGITQLPSYTPTTVPTRLFDTTTGLFYGSHIYYPNFAVKRCDSDPVYKPKWTADEDMFASKQSVVRHSLIGYQIKRVWGLGLSKIIILLLRVRVEDLA